MDGIERRPLTPAEKAIVSEVVEGFYEDCEREQVFQDSPRCLPGVRISRRIDARRKVLEDEFYKPGPWIDRSEFGNYL